MISYGQPRAVPTADVESTPTRQLRFNKKTGAFAAAPRGEKFIKGPIPLWWISRANSLGGKAGAVGVGLWFLRGVQGTTAVKVTCEVKSIAGCERHAFYHALKALEGAGLVVVHRQSGAYPVVEILGQPEAGLSPHDTPAKNDSSRQLDWWNAV